MRATFLERILRHWIATLFVCFASIPNLGAAPSTQPAPIILTGIDGKNYQPLVLSGHQAAVLVFVLQDCPICNGYAPQIQHLAAEFSPKRALFYLVHVDPTLTVAAARKHAKDYGYTIPVLIDTKHELVARLGVIAVPTAVVLGTDGSVKYQGRIDDQYVAIGKARNIANQYDLRDAINAVLNGKPVERSRTRAVGCAVPDLPARQ
jgi:peroxiredoxin